MYDAAVGGDGHRKWAKCAGPELAGWGEARVPSRSVAVGGWRPVGGRRRGSVAGGNGARTPIDLRR